MKKDRMNADRADLHRNKSAVRNKREALSQGILGTVGQKKTKPKQNNAVRSEFILFMLF